MPDTKEIESSDAFIPDEIEHPKKRAFLVALVDCGGNITRAVESIGIGRTTVYEWETSDETFAEVFRGEAIKKRASDALVDEARRRARDGWLEPVFHQGEQVATIRKYSDSLLMFLLKGDRPEYNHHRLDITSGDKPIRFTLGLGEDGDSDGD